MDPTLITKIAAAGALGVSIFCVYKVYDLLKNEQARDQPRSIFIRTIYVSMGFAILMTLLSLGIEVVRNRMSTPVNDLADKLQAIADQDYYAVDRNGNPAAITFRYQGKAYVLGKALPERYFENNALNLKTEDSDKYPVVRENLGKETVFGYLSQTELTTKLRNLFEEASGQSLGAEELLSLGLLYAPASVSNVVSAPRQINSTLANRYLVDLISQTDENSADLRERAIKLLIQPQLMSKLKPEQYEKLIAALQSGVRGAPYDKYELAQVYLSRSWQTWNQDKRTADVEKHKELLREYVRYYEANRWIQDTTRYKREYDWYQANKSI